MVNYHKHYSYVRSGLHVHVRFGNLQGLRNTPIQLIPQEKRNRESAASVVFVRKKCKICLHCIKQQRMAHVCGYNEMLIFSK